MGKKTYSYDDGQIVFIGDRRKSDVIVLWTEAGHELAALKALERGADEPLCILAVDFMTPAAVDAFRLQHRNVRKFGYWFKRTPMTTRSIKLLNDEMRAAA